MSLCHSSNFQHLTSHSRPTALLSPPRPPSCWESWMSVAHRHRTQTSPIPWLRFHSFSFPTSKNLVRTASCQKSQAPVAQSQTATLLPCTSPLFSLTTSAPQPHDTNLKSFIFCPPSLDHTVDLNPAFTSICLLPLRIPNARHDLPQPSSTDEEKHTIPSWCQGLPYQLGSECHRSRILSLVLCRQSPPFFSEIVPASTALFKPPTHPTPKPLHLSRQQLFRS